MSDDEDAPFAKRPRTIHYGSLEEAERERQKQLNQPAADEDFSDDVSSPAAAEPPVPVKKIPTATNLAFDEYFDIETEVAKDKQLLLEEFEKKRKARLVNVSTDDEEVKRNLRQLNEPICYFGEGPAERRNRLRELLVSVGEHAIKSSKVIEDEERKQQYLIQQQQLETTWYHEGPDSLRISRLWIADYSLPRSKDRLEKAKLVFETPSATKAGKMVELQKRIQSLSLQCSQVGDTRPISDCAFDRFSSESKYLVTSSWAGLCKVWNIPDCTLRHTLRGHAGLVGGVCFRPGVDPSDENAVCIASGGHDGAVKLWSLGSEESVADINGHMPHRVSKVEFHPSGRFLATTCYDSSWRLWDLEQKTEVLHQEGHAKAVHCLAFQVDGSVIVTGGLDAFGRVWDLRTGKFHHLFFYHIHIFLNLKTFPRSLYNVS